MPDLDLEELIATKTSNSMKIGEKYYYIKQYKRAHSKILIRINVRDKIDIDNIRFGNVFKTREEAENLIKYCEAERRWLNE